MAGPNLVLGHTAYPGLLNQDRSGEAAVRLSTAADSLWGSGDESWNLRPWMQNYTLVWNPEELNLGVKGEWKIVWHFQGWEAAHC